MLQTNPIVLLFCVWLFTVHGWLPAPRGCYSAITQLHYFLCCHGNEAHSASMAKLGMQVSGDIRAKLYCAAERNLSLGQQESRGEILNARKGWEKETQRRKRGENCTHTHGVHLHCDKAVYCTFVSRTDIILSLASLTFSLFPHTLMWGSAGRKKGKQWEIEEHVFNVRVSQCW